MKRQVFQLAVIVMGVLLSGVAAVQGDPCQDAQDKAKEACALFGSTAACNVAALNARAVCALFPTPDPNPQVPSPFLPPIDMAILEKGQATELCTMMGEEMYGSYEGCMGDMGY